MEGKLLILLNQGYPTGGMWPRRVPFSSPQNVLMHSLLKSVPSLVKEIQKALVKYPM
jgi:hypothetical protein